MKLDFDGKKEAVGAGADPHPLMLPFDERAIDLTYFPLKYEYMKRESFDFDEFLFLFGHSLRKVLQHGKTPGSRTKFQVSHHLPCTTFYQISSRRPLKYLSLENVAAALWRSITDLDARSVLILKLQAKSILRKCNSWRISPWPAKAPPKILFDVPVPGSIVYDHQINDEPLRAQLMLPYGSHQRARWYW